MINLRYLISLEKYFLLLMKNNTPINEYNPYSKMNSQISISKEIKNAIKNTQFKNSSLRNIFNPFSSKRAALHPRSRPKPIIPVELSQFSPCQDPSDQLDTSIFQNETISSKSNHRLSQLPEKQTYRIQNPINKIIENIVAKAEEKISLQIPKFTTFGQRKSIVEILLPPQQKPYTSQVKSRRNHTFLQMDTQPKDRENNQRKHPKVKNSKREFKNFICKGNLITLDCSDRGKAEPSRINRTPNINIPLFKMKQYLKKLKRRSQIKSEDFNNSYNLPCKIHIHNLSYENLPNQNIMMSPISNTTASCFVIENLD